MGDTDAMHDGNRKMRTPPSKPREFRDWADSGLFTVQDTRTDKTTGQKLRTKPTVKLSFRYKKLSWTGLTPEKLLEWQRDERIKLERKFNKHFLLTNTETVADLTKEVCDSSDPDEVRFYDNSQGYISSGLKHLVGARRGGPNHDPDDMSGRKPDGFLFKCPENGRVASRDEWVSYREGMKERKESGSSGMNDNIVDLMEGRTMVMIIAVLCKSEEAFKKSKDLAMRLAAEVCAEAEAADVAQALSGADGATMEVEVVEEEQGEEHVDQEEEEEEQGEEEEVERETVQRIKRLKIRRKYIDALEQRAKAKHREGALMCECGCKVTLFGGNPLDIHDMEVDHEDELADGGADDPGIDGLTLMTRICHGRKTRARALERRES